MSRNTEDFILDEDNEKEGTEDSDDLDDADEAALLDFDEDDNVEIEDDVQYVDEDGNEVQPVEGDSVVGIHKYTLHDHPSSSSVDDDVLDVGIDPDFDTLGQDTEDLELLTSSVNTRHSTYDRSDEASDLGHVKGTDAEEQHVEQEEDERDVEEHQNLPSREDEEEDQDDEEDRRERFRSERQDVSNSAQAKKRTDIPDTLDSVISKDEQTKVDEFLNKEKEKRENRRGNWHRRGPQRGGQRFRPPVMGTLNRSGSFRMGNFRGGLMNKGNRNRILPIVHQRQQHIEPWLFNHPPHNHGSSLFSSPSIINSQGPQKIFVNPQFRGPGEPERLSFAPQSPSRGLYHSPPPFPLRRGMSDFSSPFAPNPHIQAREPFPSRNFPSVRNFPSARAERLPYQLDHRQNQMFEPSRFENFDHPLRSQDNEYRHSPGNDRQTHGNFQAPNVEPWLCNNNTASDYKGPPPPQPSSMYSSGNQVPFSSPPAPPPQQPPSSQPYSVQQHPPPPPYQPLSEPPPQQQPQQPPQHPPPQPYIPHTITSPFIHSEPPIKDLPPQSLKQVHPPMEPNRYILQRPQPGLLGHAPPGQPPQFRHSAPPDQTHLNNKRKSSLHGSPPKVARPDLQIRKARKQNNLNRTSHNSNIKEVPIVDHLPPPEVPKATLPPEEEEDEKTKELRKKIEEQTRIREQILRMKEERRKQAAVKRQKELQERKLSDGDVSQEQLPEQAPVVHPSPAVVKKVSPVQKANVKLRLGVKQNILQEQQNQQQQQKAPVVKKVVVLRRNPGQQPQQQQFQHLRPQQILKPSPPQQQTNKSFMNNNNNIITLTQHQNTQVALPAPKKIIRISQNPRPGALQQTMTRGPIKQRIGMPVGSVQTTPANVNKVGSALQMTGPVNVPPEGQATQAKKIIKIVNSNNQKLQQTVGARKVLVSGNSPGVISIGRGKTVQLNRGNQHSVGINQVQKSHLVRITNLAASTNEAQLRKLCSTCGVVEGLRINSVERQAVVKFKEPIQAFQFQKRYQRHMLDLSLIQVSLLP